MTHDSRSLLLPCINLHFLLFFFYRIGFVLYMSVRIRTDNITQEDLALEIDSNVPLAHAVEMSAPGTKDPHGAYANLTAKGNVV